MYCYWYGIKTLNCRKLSVESVFKYVNEINTKSTILSQSNVLYIRKAKTEYLIRSFTVYRCDLSLRFTCKPFLESL